MNGSSDDNVLTDNDALQTGQRVRDFLRFAPLMPLSTVSGCVAIALCLWPVLPAAWALCFCVGAALAVAQWRSARVLARSRVAGNAPQQATVVQRRWVCVNALVAGAFWGLASIALFPTGSPGHQLLLAFILTGVTVAWLPFFALVRVSLLAFTVFGVLPMAFELLSSPQAPQTTMGSLLFALIGALALIAHVTSRILFADSAARRALYHQATHDALVGVANRSEFHRRVRTLEIMGATTYAIVFIDLDNFKQINDTAGHAVGDELLRRIGEVLRSTVRQGDTPARLGGDEFAVLMEGCSAAEAARVAKTLLERICAFRLVGDPQARRVTASIGIACSDDLFASPAKLLEAADHACYRAKRGGRNRIEIATKVPAAPSRPRSRTEFSLITDLTA